MSIRFSAEDLALFASASHDRNPLHLSAAYARKTPFGQQVVYGALGALACLRSVHPPRGQRLAAMAIHYINPIFLDVEYQLLASANMLRLMDGSTEILSLQLEFCPGETLAPRITEPSQAPRATADLPDESMFTPGFSRSGEYQPDPTSAAALMQRHGIEVGTLPLAALLWSSYLTGMELPGEQALYFRMRLRFADAVPPEGPLKWEAKLVSKNAMSLLRSEVRLSVGTECAATCLLYTSPSPRDLSTSRMPSSA